MCISCKGGYGKIILYFAGGVYIGTNNTENVEKNIYHNLPKMFIPFDRILLPGIYHNCQKYKQLKNGY